MRIVSARLDFQLKKVSERIAKGAEGELWSGCDDVAAVALASLLWLRALSLA